MSSPSSTTTIRPARPADHSGIARVLTTGYDGFDPTTEYFAYVTDPDRWVPDATQVFVAVDDLGDVVGVVAFALQGTPLHEPVIPPMGDASFRFLAVDPSARGHGVGRALVRACIDAARGAACRRLAIFTMEFMEDAQRLYPRLGFVRRPDCDVIFPGGRGRALVRDLADDADEHFATPGPVPDSPPWYADVFDRPDRRRDQPD